MGNHQKIRRIRPDTICAVATASGYGGIGIIRISGDKAKFIAQQVLKKIPIARVAELLNFYTRTNMVLDKGIALFFKAPHSFTGEDVLELHAHGGPVLLNLINQEVLALGARQARPGEFSERAFLNKKIDLTQAEAIVDIINASSAQAVISANKSLQGDFAKHIQILVDELIKLRVFVESAMDFPEEEISFIEESDTHARLLKLSHEIIKILKAATMGKILREGLKVVIVGAPNVGKSSLLNYLAGEPIAIVSDIPGTTRDILRAQIQIDGIPLHIIDTAGFRDSKNTVEQEGIRRTKQESKKADCLLRMMSDVDDTPKTSNNPIDNIPTITLYNKIDISGGKAGFRDKNIIGICAKTGAGIDDLKHKLKDIAGFVDLGEGVFVARQRHLQALKSTKKHINNALKNIGTSSELLAEDLRFAQNSLSEITGEFTNNDLLDKIFADFCIGK